MDLLGVLNVEIFERPSVQIARERLGDGRHLCAAIISMGPRDSEEVRSLITALRRTPVGSNVHVLILTTMRGVDPCDELCSVLYKPFDADELLAKTRALVSGCSHP